MWTNHDMNLLLLEHTCHFPKSCSQKSHHQRAKQKRQRVSEMGTSSGAIFLAKREKSPDNDQSPHRRWDQVCRNKISNTDRKTLTGSKRKVKTLRWMFLVGNTTEWLCTEQAKTKMCATNKPFDDRVKRDVAFFLCERVSALLHEQQIIMEENITVCGPCQDLGQNKFWKSMKRFADVWTAGQREQVKIWLTSKISTSS